MWRRALKLPEPIVLLVDDCDAPIAAHLDDPEKLEAAKALTNDFFLGAKAGAGNLRFTFLTGTFQLRQLSLFAGFNNCEDISLHPSFGVIAGLTEADLRTAFGPWLRRAAELNGVSVEALLRDLRIMYRGYAFDEAGTGQVYATKSVLQFLEKPELGLRPCLQLSGVEMSVLSKALQAIGQGRAVAPADFEVDQAVPVSALTGADAEFNAIALLTQAGILTIKGIRGNTAYVGLPNEEARMALAALCAQEGQASKREGMEGMTAAVRL